MEEIKQNWKKRASWLLIALIVVVVYKMLDKFSYVQEWFGTFFRILKPFFAGLLIAYILLIPCRKIEEFYKKAKPKFIAKRARGLSVISIYLILALIIIVVINWIIPVIKDSVVELFNNIPSYYNIMLEKINEIPEESILKADTIKEGVEQLQNIDIKQILADNNEKILEYAKNIINVFLGIFDVFVSFVVSVYILLQRASIFKFLKRLSRAIFKKETFETIDKYFMKGNEVFFTYISSQLLDGFIVGVLTTIAMLILKVKYAPLLGFMIGLFNLIPYIGAIVAVGISILITLITGGIGKTIAMAIVVIILQQIDANIINPKIIGSSLSISPLLVIFAVTVGGAYFGILGMVLGVPIVVVIKTILNDFIDSRNEKKDKEEGITN